MPIDLPIDHTLEYIIGGFMLVFIIVAFGYAFFRSESIFSGGEDLKPIPEDNPKNKPFTKGQIAWAMRQVALERAYAEEFTLVLVAFGVEGKEPQCWHKFHRSLGYVNVGERVTVGNARGVMSGEVVKVIKGTADLPISSYLLTMPEFEDSYGFKWVRQVTNVNGRKKTFLDYWKVIEEDRVKANAYLEEGRENAKTNS